MRVYFVRARKVDPPAAEASAFVVADDEEEAVLLLRKDIDFTGYRLPPFEMTMYDASSAQVRGALGDAASTEKGVYAFTTGDPLAATSAREP